VGGEAVGNEMNLLAARLIGDHFGEEGDELLAGMTGGGFAHHLATLVLSAAYSVRSGVAIVFKPAALQPPGRQRKTLDPR